MVVSIDVVEYDWHHPILIQVIIQHKPTPPNQTQKLTRHLTLNPLSTLLVFIFSAAGK